MRDLRVLTCNEGNHAKVIYLGDLNILTAIYWDTRIAKHQNRFSRTDSQDRTQKDSRSSGDR